MPDSKTGEFRGNRNLKRLRRISQTKQEEEIARGLEFGLEAAGSINDRNISLFSRGHQPAFAGINTFMKTPYCEDVRIVGDAVRSGTEPFLSRSHKAAHRRHGLFSGACLAGHLCTSLHGRATGRIAPGKLPP